MKGVINHLKIGCQLGDNSFKEQEVVMILNARGKIKEDGEDYWKSEKVEDSEDQKVLGEL